MRTVLGLIALAIATPAAAQEMQAIPAYANAETCLRQQAAEAVRVGQGATDAAEFLLLYACAGPVDAASAYKRNTEALEAYRQAMQQMGALTAENASASESSTDSEQESGPLAPNSFMSMEGVSVDGVTGEVIVANEGGPMAAMVAAQAKAQAKGQVLDIPAFLRTLAAQVVLTAPR